jgi:hypothetical protein
MAEKISVYRIYSRTSEGKIQLGRHRRRWDDNNKIDFKQIERSGVDWIRVAQDSDQ